MTIEVTAKKVEDAIKQGLEQLGVGLDEVDVKVVEQGGLFRKAKVRLTVEREENSEKNSAEPQAKDEAQQLQKPEKSQKSDKPAAVEKQNKPQSAAHSDNKPQKSEKQNEAAKPEKSQKQAAEAQKQKPEKPQKQAEPRPRRSEGGEPRQKTPEDMAAVAQAVEFVKDLVKHMGFEQAEITTRADGEYVDIAAPSGDDSLIIGRHGETLSSIAFLAETLARAEKHHINITVDCNGYRDRRAASLSAMAKRRASECVAKHRKIKLEPMDRIDRRTIHAALTEDGRVVTSSEGKEPYRCVVIFPKK